MIDSVKFQGPWNTAIFFERLPRFMNRLARVAPLLQARSYTAKAMANPKGSFSRSCGRRRV